MRTMKKGFFLLILICSMGVLSSCARQPEEPFDFSRYNGKSVDVFLEDYGLTMEDFEKSGTYDYNSKEKLSFMNRKGRYEIHCDKQGNIGSIEIVIPEEWDKAEDLYKTALEIEKYYEDIETAENYFDSFDGEPFRKTIRYTDEDGRDCEVKSNVGVYSQEADIRKYPTYKDFKAADDLPNNIMGPEVVGIWNLENSIQVRMSYNESSREDFVGIRILFQDSTGKNAAEFGEANKEK